MTMVDDNERRLHKTFSGTLENPSEMEKARQMMEQAAQSAPTMPSPPDTSSHVTVDIKVREPSPFSTLERQAEVAQRFEVGMDKITDVLLVVGLKLSQGARAVMLGLTAAFILILGFALLVVVMMSKLREINGTLRESMETQVIILRGQEKNEGLVKEALKRAEEARDRAELAAKKLEQLESNKATIQVENGRPVIEFTIPGEEEKSKVQLPRSSLQ